MRQCMPKKRYKAQKTGVIGLQTLYRWRAMRNIWAKKLWAALFLENYARGYLERSRMILARERTKRLVVHMAKQFEKQHGIDITGEYEALTKLSRVAYRLVKSMENSDIAADAQKDMVSFKSMKFKVKRVHKGLHLGGRITPKVWRELCGDLEVPPKVKFPRQYKRLPNAVIQSHFSKI